MKRTSFLLACLTAILVLIQPLSADDRDFVRTSSEDPYVFVLFDVSGSMNWTGSQGGLCPGGDCNAPMSGDDRLSKFYQAKKALYEALAPAENVNFGFATYNQDNLVVLNKHFRYVAQGNGVSISGSPGNYPQVGAVENFGPQFSPICDTNGSGDDNDDEDVGCYRTEPADITNTSNDSWELERVRRLPKPTGDDYFYIRTGNNTIYRMRYDLVGGSTVGDPNITVAVNRRSCNNSGCSGTSVTENVVFRRQALTLPAPPIGDPPIQDEFLHWDIGTRRGITQRGYFGQSQSSDTDASNTCSGWDPNTDSNSDDFGGYNIRYPTVAGPDSPTLTYGDIIPLSWTDDHKDEILSRFAPTPLIYGTAPYYEDTRHSGQNYLRLKDTNLRPIVPYGSTPLARSMRDFRNWVDTWAGIASANDPDFGCRQKYLIIITDGADTCGGENECTMATHLRDRGFRTYVVGFGLTGGPATSLNCIATNGGTSTPLLPQDGDELRDAITSILNQVREASRSFASAAVPSVDASSDDSIYLTDFTPISPHSIWNGRLDAYLKPLPLTPAGFPDRARDCTTLSLTANCHSWDGGTVMLSQAPDSTEVGLGNFRLGLTATQRRVFYAKSDFTLALFEPPSNAVDWPSLLVDLGFNDTDSTDPAVIARATAIMAETLVIKEASIPVDPDDPSAGTIDIDYVLGDIFHSDPVVIQSPSSFNRFASNLFSTGQPCDLTATSDVGYQCFAFKHRNRRRMLLAGANDGQVHAFNTGIYDSTTRKFDNGDGTELFAYIPRMVLPIVREMAEGDTHIYGVDGSIAKSDVFIHPRVGSVGAPDPDQREWRTVIIGGLREGGLKLGGDIVQKPESASPLARDFLSGYYALDITQPDPLSHLDIGQPSERFEPSAGLIPGCLRLDGTIPAGCGPVPYPAVLWEFQDLSPTTGEPLDEDTNSYGDLGQTWTEPIITRVNILEGGVAVTHNVAIFGGGLDPLNKTSANPNSGNWIYIVDIETGQAIYKRQVLGSVPELTALDADLDDIVDYIYAGTTYGRLYKVDLTTPQPIETMLVQPLDILGIPSSGVKRVIAPEWEPFAVFRTHDDQPIYIPPSLVYVGSQGQFAIGFGTGDRQDLWFDAGEEGRFYFILDTDFVRTDLSLPLDESAFYGFDPDDPALIIAGAEPDLLATPELVDPNNRPGWYMRLDPDERFITKVFAFSGVLIFNSFQPDIVIINPGGDAGCARTGTTGNFVVFAQNGNPLADLDEADGDNDRYRYYTGFLGSPYVEQTATGNQSNTPGGGGTGGTGGTGGVGGTDPESELDCLTVQSLTDVAYKIREGQPPNSKYGNYFFRLRSSSDDGRQVTFTCVPIAVNIRNWKEN
ncbi:MAG: hypothetical protein K8J08_04370 [Thermoanaerobaculia bacterium]|nr:hypothetical protein [Thermoanaerobaculia bacterium]